MARFPRALNYENIHRGREPRLFNYRITNHCYLSPRIQSMEMTKNRIALLALTVSNIGIIAVLLYVKFNAQQHIELAAQHLEDLGDQEINHTVFVNTTIPLDTEIEVMEPIEVEIELTIDNYVRIKANVPVRDLIKVPIDLRIKENIELDTTINVLDLINVNLDTEIAIDQKFLIPRGKRGKGITIPIKARIPVNQDVQIAFNEPMRVNSTIAVDMPIQQSIEVEFELVVPMDQDVPLHLPIKTKAMVTFRHPMKVKGEIPVVLEIPVIIPLSKTPIKKSMKNVAKELRKIVP